MSLTSRNVIFTSTARSDLHNIRVHLEAYDELNSSNIAVRDITDLVHKIYDIAAKGLTGSRRVFAPEHVRAFPYKRHCFYFTIEDKTLTVLRVLAQAQDVEDIIFAPSD